MRLILADVPGGSTELLVRRLKSFGTGKDREVPEEYEFDSALVQHSNQISNAEHLLQTIFCWGIHGCVKAFIADRDKENEHYG